MITNTADKIVPPTTLRDTAGRLIGWVVAPKNERPIGRTSGTVLLVRPQH